MIDLRAIWFSKLKHFDDTYEGRTPSKVKEKISKQNDKWKRVFKSKYHHEQIDNSQDRNDEDGRELLVASCWFMSEGESEKMWTEYSDISTGLLVKSSVRKLASYIYVYPDFNSHIGKVRYVDVESFKGMDTHVAHCAHERAFIKDKKFSEEKELRIITMNIKTPTCVNTDGGRYALASLKGTGCNNFNERGLLISANINELLDEIIIAPKANASYYDKICDLVKSKRVFCKVLRSSL